jgi:hypothetical protein
LGVTMDKYKPKLNFSENFLYGTQILNLNENHSALSEMKCVDGI